MTLQNGRETISLDRRRKLVSAKLDVVKHDRVQACILELEDRVNSVATAGSTSRSYLLYGLNLSLALKGHCDLLQPV